MRLRKGKDLPSHQLDHRGVAPAALREFLAAQAQRRAHCRDLAADATVRGHGDPFRFTVAGTHACVSEGYTEPHCGARLRPWRPWTAVTRRRAAADGTRARPAGYEPR